MAFFCAAIKKNQFLFKDFSFRSYVQIFSFKILLVFHLKYSCCFFFSFLFRKNICLSLCCQVGIYGVMFNALDCGIVVSEFELQSCYYVHFRTNTIGKEMNPPYPPRYGLNSCIALLLEGLLWH